MPRVSIVIPAYNAEKFIEKCMLSLQAQSFRDFEVIVADDGSTDRTVEIASRYATVVRAQKNMGEGSARNMGAREANGEILVFTDSDVVAPENWLERIVTVMDTRGIKCLGGGYKGTVGNSFIERYAFLELAYRRRNMPEFVNTLVTNNLACYKEIFHEVGGFTDRFGTVEDLYFSYRVGLRHRLFWDRYNGVYHHFRETLSGYLKQQYSFGRDTVMAFFEKPELLKVSTHQGRAIHLEVAFTMGFYSFLLFKPLYSFLCFLFILGINSGFLLFLLGERLRISAIVGTVFLRNTVVAYSVIAGFFRSLVRLYERRQKPVSQRGSKNGI